MEMNDDSSKEREIMMIMRKVLAQIVKDTTPASKEMRHVLSDQTISDIRSCLGMISLRERELADIAGVRQERPYYADERQTAEVVSINKIGRVPEKDND